MSQDPLTEDQLPVLQMLLNQQLSEYREIKDLREKLRTAEMRHQALADEIQRVLTALPVSGEAISLTPAGHAPASTIPSAGRGFSEDEDLCYDPPELTARNERRAYADSVGMRLHEKIR